MLDLVRCLYTTRSLWKDYLIYFIDFIMRRLDYIEIIHIPIFHLEYITRINGLDLILYVNQMRVFLCMFVIYVLGVKCRS